MAFEWNPKQKELIDAVFKEGWGNLFCEGGIGAGKSLAMLYIIDFICRKTPGMIALIGRKTYDSIIMDTHAILKVNPGILDLSKGEWKDSSRQFDYHNGSRIYFRHYDNAESLLGPTFGLIYLEQAEQIKKDDYLILLGRLRQWNRIEEVDKNEITNKYIKLYKNDIKSNQLLSPKNYLFLTANPAPGWIKDEFINKKPKNFRVLHLKTQDNRYLPADTLERLNNQSDAFKARYMEGSWEFSSGLVYAEFGDDNIVDGDFEVDSKIDFSKLKIYIIVDPGYAVSKFAVLMAAVLPNGNLYIFNEVVRNGKDEEEIYKVGVPEVVKAIKEELKRFNIINYYGLIDFAANARIGGNTSMTAQIRELGIDLNNARKDNEIDSIFRIKTLLKDKKIIVHSRCTWTIREFGLFMWDAKRDSKVKDADNDLMDCLRYLVNDFPTANEVKKSIPNDSAILLALYTQELFSDKNEIRRRDHTSEDISKLNVIKRDNITWGL